eukprot:CAMPEP_0194041992 /NCGR_PEP_ID=MMETSP0009_2-20130614/13798_1 /TAXON_ID=210454 /ORGANISM="Grammatophora oceanica, Strain CCMP 410" /LENGTH=116 /DNA_ID=CAMNT_0038685667 /DNA_START=316 /DNA_END=663 /DNA_ORIENTATION=+
MMMSRRIQMKLSTTVVLVAWFMMVMCVVLPQHVLANDDASVIGKTSSMIRGAAPKPRRRLEDEGWNDDFDGYVDRNGENANNNFWQRDDDAIQDQVKTEFSNLWAQSPSEWSALDW